MERPLPQLGAHAHGVASPRDRASAWLQAICRCSPPLVPRVRHPCCPLGSFVWVFLISLPSRGFPPSSHACIPQLPAAVARASPTFVIRVYSRACLTLRPAAGAAVLSPRIMAASAAMASTTCSPSFPGLPSGSNVIVSTNAPFVGGGISHFSLW